MGIRDRIRGVLGRERAVRPALSEVPLRLVSSAPRYPGPTRIAAIPEGAWIVAQAIPDVRAYAARVPPGARIVVVDVDEEQAAGLAERIASLVSHAVQVSWMGAAP